jgi:hypothetical protein
MLVLAGELTGKWDLHGGMANVECGELRSDTSDEAVLAPPVGAVGAGC